MGLRDVASMAIRISASCQCTEEEVGLRDGLQLEDPLPLSAKLELLDALVATGVREIEATAFVSPSKVPALADAAELAAAQERKTAELAAKKAQRDARYAARKARVKGG